MRGGYRVLLIEDHHAVSEALARVLGAEPDFEIVGTVATGAEAMHACEWAKPDVVVLDLGLPDMDGIDVARGLRARAPDARIVVLTATVDPVRIRAAVGAGVHGFVSKTAALDHVIDAVRAAARGEHAATGETSGGVRDANGPARADPARRTSSAELTPRELDVMRLLATGITTREIASRLGLSAKTIETHRARIYAKLEVSSAAGAVRAAIRAGLIEA